MLINKGRFIMIKKAHQILNQPFLPELSFILARAILVGVLTGGIVGIFRWIIDQTMKMLYFLYPQLAANHLLLIPYLVVMILICFILGKITSPYLNDLVGSGVPQIEAVFLNENQMKWWQILWRKFIGGLLAICPGLMLGREGPCIEMGAMVGQGLAQDFFHGSQEEVRLLQQSGVAAGLSAAFSAPLAGAFFLVEEITFSFKSKEVISALIASFSADLVTLLFFGTKPCLYIPIKSDLPLKAYWALPIIGIILGLLAYLYQYYLLSLKPIFSKIKFIPRAYQSIIPLFLIIPIGIWNAHLLGGSHVLIMSLFKQKFEVNPRMSALSFILLPILLFAIRFVFSMISYGSSVPGGIFMPILVLGALLGVAFANVLISNNIISGSFYPHIIVISMCAYFGAIEKAPFTAVILLTEMVGTVEQVLPMIITTFIAYYILDLLGGRPIYEALRLQMNYLEK